MNGIQYSEKQWRIIQQFAIGRRVTEDDHEDGYALCYIDNLYPFLTLLPGHNSSFLSAVNLGVRHRVRWLLSYEIHELRMPHVQLAILFRTGLDAFDHKRHIRRHVPDRLAAFNIPVLFTGFSTVSAFLGSPASSVPKPGRTLRRRKTAFAKNRNYGLLQKGAVTLSHSPILIANSLVLLFAKK